MLSETVIASYLQHYRELLKSKDPISCKQLVEEFVERVTINKDTLKLPLRCLWIHLVEAGGIEPTVRKTDHRRLSERRL
ncbi:hypothetical protein PTH_2711 [Pelotomaculum thermopropionicum SI]|uniref:Uncharacterized protein n=1 Tax=Pelotomaculum thermopropionicum (strain DSM 13744 / JCM 10971 / SI) TaxID=370438 RepID=A5CYM7_PELTS|nr:hypothetical protein PTH_2711 [Pelotomaculum thermopropionicum SI]